MKAIPYHLACCALLFGTFWGGYQNGSISNRWAGNQSLQRAAEQLRKPMAVRVGNWRLQAEQPFTADIVDMLQCPAHICRTYVNDQTGETINFAVIVGPPGPISVHSPEVCYSSQDFRVTGARTATNVVDRDGDKHQFWELKLQSNGTSPMPLRVLFGWGLGGSWSASQRARFEYAGSPYLYKLQLATTATDSNDENNACQDFLQAILPELKSCLLPVDSSFQPSTVSLPRKPD